MPENEVWIKIGGDHGSISFKLCLQVCNVEKPNSKENTVVFCCKKICIQIWNHWPVYMLTKSIKQKVEDKISVSIHNSLNQVI